MHWAEGKRLEIWRAESKQPGEKMPREAVIKMRGRHFTIELSHGPICEGLASLKAARDYVGELAKQEKTAYVRVH